MRVVKVLVENEKGEMAEVFVEEHLAVHELRDVIFNRLNLLDSGYKQGTFFLADKPLRDIDILSDLHKVLIYFSYWGSL